MTNTIDQNASLWDNIKNARKEAAEKHSLYHEMLNQVYVSSLTKDDEDALSKSIAPKYKMPIIAPFVRRQVETITDGIPSFTVKTNDPNQLTEAMADKLNVVIKDQLDRSAFKRQNYKVIRDSIAGGFGIYKIKLEYANKLSFEQNIRLEAVSNPTNVYFDPCAKQNDMSDASFCFTIEWVEDVLLKKKYPNVNFDLLQFGGGSALTERSEGEDSKRKEFEVCDYYYIETGYAKIYELEGGEVVFKKPEDASSIVRTRLTAQKTCKFQRVVGNQILEEAKLPFSTIPFVQVCAEVVIDEDDHKTIVPYAAPAIHAQRLKSIATNLYAAAAFATPPGRLAIPQEAFGNKNTQEIMRSVTSRDILVYKQFSSKGGIQTPVNPPHYMTPPPISPEYANLANISDNVIKQTLGVEFDINQVGNMSGKALYNMADFVNSNVKGFVESLLGALKQCGQLFLEGLKATNRELASTPTENADIIVESGINYKLQQQATLEMLMELAQVSPTFAQFMDKEGVKLMLQNMDLNSKAELTTSYDGFEEALKKQPPRILPQVQMEQQKMQMEAQKQQQSFELKQQEHNLKAAELNIETQKLQLDAKQAENKAAKDATDSYLDKYKAEMDLQMEQLTHQMNLLQTIIAHSGKNNHQENMA